MIKSVAICLAASAFLLGTLTTEETTASSPPADATYVGADACKKCHFKQHKTWKAMKHAGAWEVLSEEYRDPAQMDDDGRACVSCHVTGWGEASGFVDATASAHLLGVQCESCHGPGSLHVELGQQMLKEKRKELAAGEEWHVVLKTTNCSDCHNPHVDHEEFRKD